MKYHPDKNAGDTQAAEQFKYYQEAYHILSDPETRQQYNNYGKDFFTNGGSDSGSMADIFSTFFSGGFSS